MSMMRSLAAVCVGLVVCVFGAHAEPEVFSDAGLEADKAAAAEQGKLHIVYFYTSWHGTHPAMLYRTWSDPWLAAWLDERAIVSAVNADDAAVSREFRVRATPTVVVMKDGEELGRTLRLLGAEQMREWIEDPSGALSGAPTPKFNEVRALKEKLDLAPGLLVRGEYEKSAELYAELWDTMLDIDPSAAEYRMTEVLGGIGDVVDVYEESSDRFIEIRDREGELIKAGNVTAERVRDWISLNGVLYEEDATMEWIDSAKDDPIAMKFMMDFGPELTDQVYETGRGDLMVFLVPGPLTLARDNIRPTARAALESGDSSPFDDIYTMLDALRAPVTAVLHMDDGGEAEKALIAQLDKISGESEAWRAAFIIIANTSEKIRQEHRDWSEKYELRERYGGQWWGEPPF